jgi:hypothetical protein
MSLLDSTLGNFAQRLGMGTRRLRELLSAQGVSVPLSAGCLEHFARDAHEAVERARAPDEPYASCLQRQLEARVRFIQLWTETDEKFDRAEWSTLVEIARRYALPRPWKLPEQAASERHVRIADPIPEQLIAGGKR